MERRGPAYAHSLAGTRACEDCDVQLQQYSSLIDALCSPAWAPATRLDTGQPRVRLDRTASSALPALVALPAAPARCENSQGELDTPARPFRLATTASPARSLGHRCWCTAGRACVVTAVQRTLHAVVACTEPR